MHLSSSKNSTQKNKLAIVVQRYGNEVCGGAEYHARLLAERLSKYYEITVLTSCSLNNGERVGWDSHYPVGCSAVNEIKVLRFDVPEAYRKKMKNHSGIVGRLVHFMTKCVFYFLGKKKEYKAKHRGPYLPDLIEYIQKNKSHFDAFLFFTYLFYPSVEGLKTVPEKSIFIPTAHDEPMFYKCPKNLFHLPKLILYNTQSEKALVERVYKNENVASDVVGIGINEDIEKDYVPTEQAIKNRPYIIFIGRISKHKDCDTLIEYVERYRHRNPHVDIELLMVGKRDPDIQDALRVRFLGFLDDNDKFYYLKNAAALVIPSKYESLSLVALESFYIGTPIMANEACEVLKQHILKSEAGLYYKDYHTFEQSLQSILTNQALRKKFIQNGKTYYQKEYSWNTILNKIRKGIDKVIVDAREKT